MGDRVFCHLQRVGHELVIELREFFRRERRRGVAGRITVSNFVEKARGGFVLGNGGTSGVLTIQLILSISDLEQ